MSYITDFIATPTNNTGELKLTWLRGSGVIGQKILMSGSRYPSTVTDGIEIYSELGMEVTIGELLPEKFYYFTLFYNIGAGYITDTRCKISGLTIQVKEFKNYSGFGEYTYRKLPELYRYMDKFQNTPDTLPLKRFLSIFGSQFDFLYSRINALKNTVTDIDKTSDVYLDRMSKMFGWTSNNEIPLDRQRMELKGIYEFYKNKGTLTGIVNFVVAVSGFYARIKEFRSLCFKTNTSNHKTMDTSSDNVINYETYRQTYNNTYPTICNASRDGEWYKYRLNSIGVFIYGDPDGLSPSGLTQAQIEAKLERMWVKILPAGVDGYLVWENLSSGEEVSVVDYYKTSMGSATNWVKSNTLTKTTNTLGMWTPSTSNSDDYWEE